ncbi:hypothetical protein YC2023_057143 [Brassica napus]
MSSSWFEPGLKALASSAFSEDRTYKCIMENVSLYLSNSSNRRPNVRHSTFESLRLGRSNQSIAYGFLRFWDSLNFKKDMEFVGITVLFLDENVNFVIHGFTLVGRANHYMPSLKACSIVKVDRFEVARCSSMYKITDHPFPIRFISLNIIDEVITGAPEINLQSRLDCSTISKETNTKADQEIQETILTNTKAAATSSPAHSSYLMKIAYMLNMKQELWPQSRACAKTMPLVQFKRLHSHGPFKVSKTSKTNYTARTTSRSIIK